MNGNDKDFIDSLISGATFIAVFLVALVVAINVGRYLWL